jgi:hypothetical protein
MRIAQALAIKAVLPLSMAGVTLLSGVAIAIPSVTAAVNSVPVASAGAAGAGPNMYYK